VVAVTVLDEIQASIRQLSEGAGPSVVGIGQRWGVGSGVVLGEGRVLTNAHNVRGDQVTVTFADGRTAEGSVAGHDIDADLAVIDVDTGEAPALPWAADGGPGVGTPVFALANPGGRGLRVTFGFVSGIERTFRGPRGRRITSSTPPRCCPAPRAARSSTPADGCSASTRTGSVKASTWPYRPTRRCAAGPTHWPAVRRQHRRGSASPSLPVTSPGGSGGP
jgi:hypothetical protein